MPEYATKADLSLLAIEIDGNHTAAKRMYGTANDRALDAKSRLDELCGRNGDRGIVADVQNGLREQRATRRLVEKQGVSIATLLDRDQRSARQGAVSTLAGSAGGGASVIAIVELLKLVGVL